MTLEFDVFRISHPEYSRASPAIGVAMSRASEYTDTFHIEKFDSALYVLRDPNILDTPRSKFAGPSLVVPAFESLSGHNSFSPPNYAGEVVFVRESVKRILAAAKLSGVEFRKVRSGFDRRVARQRQPLVSFELKAKRMSLLDDQIAFAKVPAYFLEIISQISSGNVKARFSSRHTKLAL